MRKLLPLLLLLICLVPCFASEIAPTKAPSFWQQTIPYLISLGAFLLAYAAKKWLGLNIDKHQAERVLYAITNLITNVEQMPVFKTGLEKQNKVRNLILEGFPDGKKPLPKKDLNWIERNLGGVDNAIEKAFQLSHLAGLGKGILKAIK